MRREIATAIERYVELPEALATVTDVAVSPDLLAAKVRISILPAHKAGSALAAVRRQQGLIYGALKKNTVLRRIPALNFVFDDTHKNAAEIHDAIAQGLAS